MNLKALIIAADSVSPDIIFRNQNCFPSLSFLIECGASASYSAYVQKGYAGSYSSEQNWASIYTGLAPDQHEINTYMSRGEKRKPEMRDFDSLYPFWQVLNDNGISVGLWAADNCAFPIPIYGYVVSAKYQMLETPREERRVPRELQICSKDRSIRQYLEGDPPPRLYPKTLSQQGYSFEQLKQNSALAEEAVHKYHYQDSLLNFQEELFYWFKGMQKTQKEQPVDVMYLYTPTTDIIAHCCMCSDDNPVLIAAYQILDTYIGRMIREFQPETVLFMSDHGQQNFKELVPCADREIQREAFAAKDDVIWLRNGYIAFEAHNGALLFTAHALKGTFIAAGSGIRHTSIDEMRTLDIYPTIMEILGIKVKEDRTGYVVDIFNRPLMNSNKLIKAENIKRSSMAVVQNYAVSIMDVILNELYIENRFSDITIVGEEKYREIFLGNPRVTNFMPYSQFHSGCFDKVYCGIYNENSHYIGHIRIV